MEFFEKIGKKASETYKSAAEKTNKIASETKYKMKISDCKSKINDIYEEIGKKVYQKYVLSGELDIKEEINDDLKKIDELSEEIKRYELQILELSDLKECGNCKKKIQKQVKFCPECGAEQPKEVAIEAEVVQDAEKDEIKEEDLNVEETVQEENAEEVVSDTVEEENKES